jgi:hypothetical protein
MIPINELIKPNTILSDWKPIDKIRAHFYEEVIIHTVEAAHENDRRLQIQPSHGRWLSIHPFWTK